MFPANERYSSNSQAVAPVNELFMGSTQCPIHSTQLNKDDKGWAERETGAPLPVVFIGLTSLSENVKNLMKSHAGSIPLATLTTCYEAEFDPFVVNNDEGVPLEHLVTAIKGVAIQTGHGSGIKMLAITNNDLDSSFGSSKDVSVDFFYSYNHVICDFRLIF